MQTTLLISFEGGLSVQTRLIFKDRIGALVNDFVAVATEVSVDHIATPVRDLNEQPEVIHSS